MSLSKCPSCGLVVETTGLDEWETGFGRGRSTVRCRCGTKYVTTEHRVELEQLFDKLTAELQPSKVAPEFDHELHYVLHKAAVGMTISEADRRILKAHIRWLRSR